MAGVKVTDLTTLATAANDDIFYIVDTSSNTSKQIEVQNIYDGMPQFASGTFTPVESNVINGATITIGTGTYSRVGDVVTMAFRMLVQMDTGEDTTVFNISMPVASDFSTRYQASGVINADAEYKEAVIESDATNNLIEISISSVTAGSPIQNVGVILQYQII
jgi:hypothetical protein